MIVLLALPALAAEAPPALTLDDAMALVVERNPNRRSAELAEAIAAIDARRARLDRVTLTVGADADASASVVRAWDGTVTDGTSSGWDARAYGSVPLYAGGAVRANIDRADAAARVASLDLDITERELVRAAYTAYWNIKGYELRIAAAEEGLDVTRQALDIIRAKADAGLAAGIDVNRSTVDLYSQQESLLAERAALYQAEQELLRLLHLPGDDVVLVTEPPAPATGEIVVPADAGAGRPELARQEALAARAEAEVRAARSGTLPTVSLYGEAGIGTYGGVSPWFDAPMAEPVTDATAGVAFTWDAFDLFRTRDAVRQARLAADQARAATEAEQAAVAAEIRQAAREVAQLRERAPLVAEQVALARDNLQIVQDLYAQGSATILDLFDAQAAFRQARIQEASLAVALATAEVDLRWLLGDDLTAGVTR